MNTTRHQLPQLPVDETHGLAQAVNRINATNHSRGNRIANAILATVLGIVLACMALHFATPCTGASLCMAAVITPTSTTWWQRLCLRWRARILCWRLADVQATLDHVEDDLQELPEVRRHLRRQRDLLATRLADIDLATRAH